MKTTRRKAVPKLHAKFIKRAIPALQKDFRLLGVSIGGSWLREGLDEYSDLDFVVVVRNEDYDQVLKERPGIAAKLGDLLSCFSGEHVGVPYLYICLYGPPLIHVDLKFMSLERFPKRVEDPEVLWEREGLLTKALENVPAHQPKIELQWVEDRFWTWVHYLATKVGRGELYDVIGGLNDLREIVFTPLAMQLDQRWIQGVRRVELYQPLLAREMRKTLAAHNTASCGKAIKASIAIYRDLRKRADTGTLKRRSEAERLSIQYLDQVVKKTRPKKLQKS